MRTFQSLYFVIALVSHTAAKCPEICILYDVECITKGAVKFFTDVASGNKGKQESIDPLYLQRIDGKKGSMAFTLSNIKLEGLKNCQVAQLRLNVTDESYAKLMHCPILRFEYEYNKKEEFIHKKTSGTAYNNDVITIGQYGVFVSSKDHQPHFFIKSVNTLPFFKGRLTFEDEPISDHEHETYKTPKVRKAVVEYFLAIIIKKVLEIIMARVDEYSRIHSIAEVFPAREVYS